MGVCQVLGLLGLMGAVFAGFMVDALLSPDDKDEANPQGEDSSTGGLESDGEAAGGQEGGGSLLDDPDDPDAGMPLSDDGPVPEDDDVTLVIVKVKE